MLLYLAGSAGSPVSSFKENILCNQDGDPVFEFKTRCLWKSESPTVPLITQTEVIDRQRQALVAQVEWDGTNPVFVDFGGQDERLFTDMIFPKVIHKDRLVFTSPNNLEWELTARSMVLIDKHGQVLAKYLPHSRVVDGRLEAIPPGHGKNKIAAKDWLEFAAPLDDSPLPIIELLVDFILLESFRKSYFCLRDVVPPPSSTPLTFSRLRLRSSVLI